MEIKGKFQDLRVGDKYRFDDLPTSSIYEVSDIRRNGHCEVVYTTSGHGGGRTAETPAGVLTIWRETV